MMKLKDKILLAGPCSAENKKQVLETAKFLKELGASFFRAGIWKPRTAPGHFEGIGAKALPWLQEVEKNFYLKSIIEVGTTQQIEASKSHEIKGVWLGARTTINPFLVEELSKSLENSFEAIFIKNPLAPDLKLWAGSIERVRKHNPQAKIYAIHRGFSTYADSRFRNSPLWDIALSLKKEFSDIPLICDPSHMAGDRKFVAKLSQMAFDLNYDGLMLEVHPEPSKALSDANQQLSFNEFQDLLNRLTLKKNIDSFDSERLKILRSQIEKVDQNFIKLLHERKKIVEKVAKLKNEHQASTYSMNRFHRSLKTWQVQGEEFGLDADEMDLFYRLIHSMSLSWQSKRVCEES